MNDVNAILATLVLLAGIAAAAVRESPEALDSISRWAAARAWGIRCGRAEYERRKLEAEAGEVEA